MPKPAKLKAATTAAKLSSAELAAVRERMNPTKVAPEPPPPPPPPRPLTPPPYLGVARNLGTCKVFKVEEKSASFAVPLMKDESHDMFLAMDGITTITFFSGDASSAATFLRQRLTYVADANPWIGGKLVRDKLVTRRMIEGKLVRGHLVDLCFPKDTVIKDIFEFDDSLQISPTTPYHDLCKKIAASRAHLPTGFKLLETGAPVTRLTVTPDASGRGFAVIWSMSHVVGDGDTYYKVLALLSDGEEIVQLEPVRKPHAFAEIPNQIGRRAHFFQLGLPTFINYFSGLTLQRKPLVNCLYVDEVKLQAAKADALEASKNTGHFDGPLDFVSTNDVLTSAFGRLMRPRLLIMAMNFRNRIAGLTWKDAGNYEGGVLYDRHGYTHPTDIRRSLIAEPPYSRCKPLPGPLETVLSQQATVTNWASLHVAELEIPRCETTLHMPYWSVDYMALDLCNIFRPRPGKLAVLVLAKSRKVGKPQLRAALPVGEEVSPKMFPDPDEVAVEAAIAMRESAKRLPGLTRSPSASQRSFYQGSPTMKQRSFNIGSAEESSFDVARRIAEEAEAAEKAERRKAEKAEKAKLANSASAASLSGIVPIEEEEEALPDEGAPAEAQPETAEAPATDEAAAPAAVPAAES